MNNFKSFLTGKKVVLVGPASTLQGMGMGHYIDSHDVVVRLNHAWPLPKELYDDIGSRINVIYHNLNPNFQRIRRSHVVQMHLDGVKWVISTHPASESRFRHRLRRFRKVNKGLINFRAIPGSLKRRMCKRVKAPNCGIMAIADLLRYPIDSLYVTGFSFYSTGYLNYPNYKKRFAKKAVRHHSQRQNKAYLARLVAREDRLEVDPFIAGLLQEHAKRSKRNS